MGKAFLLLAHGSRFQPANQEIIQLAETLRAALTNFIRVDYAFLEKAEPTLREQLISLCRQADISSITIFPYFATAGIHVSQDIPATIAEIQHDFPDTSIILDNYLGNLEKLRSVIIDEYKKR